MARCAGSRRLFLGCLSHISQVQTSQGAMFELSRGMYNVPTERHPKRGSSSISKTSLFLISQSLKGISYHFTILRMSLGDYLKSYI